MAESSNSTNETNTNAQPQQPTNTSIQGSPSILIPEELIQMGSEIDTDTIVKSIAATSLSEDGMNCPTSPSISPNDSMDSPNSPFQIKDVTDYSQNSVIETVESEDQSEGLLRGWSNDAEDGNGKDEENKKEKALKMLKKASVAVTGSALVVAGIPLTVMPTPGGVILSGSGLALLATEFPAAQRVLDKGVDGLEKMVGEEEDDSDDSDDDDEKGSQKKKKGYTKLGINGEEEDDEVEVDGNSVQASERSNETTSFVNGSVRSMNSTNSNRSRINFGRNQERVDEVLKNARRTGKRTKKNIKSFVRGTVLPIMNKVTTKKKGDSDGESVSSSVSPRKRGKGTPNKRFGEIVISPEKLGKRENSSNSLGSKKDEGIEVSADGDISTATPHNTSS